MRRKSRSSTRDRDTEGALVRERPSPIYTFERSNMQYITVKDQAVTAALPIVLSNFPSYTEFTSLFDTYTISKVDATFMFNRTSSEAGSSVTDLMPTLVTANDYDDGNAPATVTNLLQYKSCHFHRLDTPITLSFKPKVSATVWQSLGVSGFMQPNGVQWVDAAYPGIPFYGLKYALMGDQAGGAGTNTIGYLTLILRITIRTKDTN